MNYNARYNKIHKRIVLLALIPQSAYKFKYICRLLSQGIMKASQSPVDTKLTDRDWFKAGIKMLIRPLANEDTAESPDDLNIGDGAYKLVCDGFKMFVKSVRWYLKKLTTCDARTWDDSYDWYAYSIEEEFESAYALLKWIVYQIDGGTLDEGGSPDEQEKITPYNEEPPLLFTSDEKIGVREFRPWALENLDSECRKGENLGKRMIPKEVVEKKAEIRNDYDRFLDDEQAGFEELDALLDYYESLIPDLPIEGMPMPPPPPRAEEKEPVEKNEEVKHAEAKVDGDSGEKKPGIRFTVEAKGDFTVYKDAILGSTYKISNRIDAKGTIDKLIKDLKLDRLDQLYPSWAKVKGQFIRGDASKFAKDQIFHEPKNGFDERHMSKQFTGRWRLRRDDEIMKPKKGKKKTKTR